MVGSKGQIRLYLGEGVSEMAGMDRGSSDRGQGWDPVTIEADRIRCQQSAQPDMVVPGAKLALPTVVTVGTTIRIA